MSIVVNLYYMGTNGAPADLRKKWSAAERLI